MAQYGGQDRFPTSFETVNDGSGRDAASVNVGLEVLADRTIFLRNVGFRRAVTWRVENDAPLPNLPSWAFRSTSYAPNATDPEAWMVRLSNVRAGDVIAVDMSGLVVLPNNTECFLRLGVTDNFGLGGTEVQAPGFIRFFDYPGMGRITASVSLSTQVVATASGETRIRLLGRYRGEGPEFSLALHGSLRAVLLRPTGSSD